jgi:hypothetical protein
MIRPTVLLSPGILGNCMVPSCSARAGVAFGNVLAPSVQDAVFGDDFREDVLCVCTRHYNYLRKHDGVTLGFRKVNGMLRAYVKDESF